MTTNPDKGHLPERPSALPRQKQDILDEGWTRLAIAEAAHTAPGNVPVGAVVVDVKGRVVGQDSNRRGADGDPLAHTEVIVLCEVTCVVGDDWRLGQYTLVMMLGLCAICASTYVMERVGRVVFGARSPKTGTCDPTTDVTRDPAHALTPQMREGVLVDECSVYLRGFLERQRQSGT